MSTAGRLQDLLHDAFYGYDLGYGGHAPGLSEKLSLTAEQAREIISALDKSFWGFVNAEQSKYRRIGAEDERKRREGEHSELSKRIQDIASAP